MALVCVTDFETTGFDPKKNRIIEIGAATFDDSDWMPIETFEMFVYADDILPLTDEIKRVTHISDEMVREQGLNPVEAFTQFANFYRKCDYMLAHNRKFDEEFYKNELTRHALPNVAPKFLCSIEDVPHGLDKKCKKLSHLALDYGVSVNPKGLHRALTDVLLLGDMMRAIKMTAQDIVNYMNTPWALVEAVVEKPWKDEGRSTGIAKTKGFNWNNDLKKWVKKVKENVLDLELKDSAFPMVVLKRESQNA